MEYESSMKYSSGMLFNREKDACQVRVPTGFYMSNLPDDYPAVSAKACTVDDFSQRQTMFMGLLMSEKQINTIIQNKHLFDNQLVSAAYAILSEFYSHELTKK